MDLQNPSLSGILNPFYGGRRRGRGKYGHFLELQSTKRWEALGKWQERGKQVWEIGRVKMLLPPSSPLYN